MSDIIKRILSLDVFLFALIFIQGMQGNDEEHHTFLLIVITLIGNAVVIGVSYLLYNT